MEANFLSRSKTKKFLPKSLTSLQKNITLPQTVSPDPCDLAQDVLEFMLEIKALDAVIYDVQETSSISKYVAIASGTSVRHVKGIVDNAKEQLVKKGIHPERIDGYQEGEWIVMDYSDVIVHVFYEPKRQYFKIDELFENSKKLKLNEELHSRVRSLKTGMHSLA
jgi:ribosome-associated protein